MTDLNNAIGADSTIHCLICGKAYWAFQFVGFKGGKKMGVCPDCLGKEVRE